MHLGNQWCAKGHKVCSWISQEAAEMEVCEGWGYFLTTLSDSHPVENSKHFQHLFPRQGLSASFCAYWRQQWKQQGHRNSVRRNTLAWEPRGAKRLSKETGKENSPFLSFLILDALQCMELPSLAHLLKTSAFFCLMLLKRNQASGAIFRIK